MSSSHRPAFLEIVLIVAVAILVIYIAAKIISFAFSLLPILAALVVVYFVGRLHGRRDHERKSQPPTE